MKVFHSLDTMDWGRVTVFIGASSIFWVTMKSLVPDPYNEWVSTFLLALTNAVAFVMRSGKSRVEKIEDKIDEHQADAVKKTAEIEQLIVSEVKEQSEGK